jgi:hypothetical protein
MAQKAKSIEECTEEKSIPVIVLEEKGKKMVFLNKARKTVKVITVDGCAVTAGSKCDFLVKDKNDYEHFVELKGNDVVYACEQLATSIKALSANPTQAAKHSFVVSSRVFPAIRTTVQNLQSRFKSRFNCKLIVKNQQCEFSI